MQLKKETYQEFWRGQTTPLHRQDNPTTYKSYAKELVNLFSILGYSSGPVLEIGCGNGALFPFFNFEIDNYKGIDFSPTLLEIFRTRYPNVSLLECDAAEYIPEKKYKLIFGNAVHQHFSREMLSMHISNMLESLADNGTLLLANVPYSPFRNHLMFGELFPSSRLNTSFSQILKKKIFPIYSFLSCQSDGIGFWYSLKDIQSFVSEEYVVEMFGSNFYPYRMHFSIRKNIDEC